MNPFHGAPLPAPSPKAAIRVRHRAATVTATSPAFERFLFAPIRGVCLKSQIRFPPAASALLPRDPGTKVPGASGALVLHASKGSVSRCRRGLARIPAISARCFPNENSRNVHLARPTKVSTALANPNPLNQTLPVADFKSMPITVLQNIRPLLRIQTPPTSAHTDHDRRYGRRSRPARPLCRKYA
jgi:hypothetical protein